MVNGNTWPFQTVEQRRYRFRFLNGCQSRFLILDFDEIPGVEVWQIGNEGGFLAAPVNLTGANGNRLLMGLAERADLIVDFTNVPVGDHVLRNLGPDEPFGGGDTGVDFEPADPESTGQVMAFRVVPAVDPDRRPPRGSCSSRPITRLTGGTTRPLALLEMLSEFNEPPEEFEDAPAEARLGTVEGDPNTETADMTALRWEDAVTENPAVGRDRGLGVLQRHRRRPSDAHPRGLSSRWWTGRTSSWTRRR